MSAYNNNMSHSVFLNRNPKMANSSGDHFVTPFADAIEIPKGSRVGAYQVSLSKRPISIYQPTAVQTSLTTGNDPLLSNLFYDANGAASKTGVVPQASLTAPSFDFTVPRGEFTKREFLENFQNKWNKAIDGFNADHDNAYFPYRCEVKNTEERIFLGLVPDMPPSPIKGIATNVPARVTNAEILEVQDLHTNTVPTSFVVPTATAAGSNIVSWFTAQSAIYPLQTTSETHSPASNKIYLTPRFTYVGNAHRASHFNRVAVSFCNSSQWKDLGADTGSITLRDCINSPLTFPPTRIGIVFDSNPADGVGNLYVYTTHLDTDRPLVRATISTSDMLDGQAVAVEFYQSDFGNGKDSVVTPGLKVNGAFYFRVIAVSPLPVPTNETAIGSGGIIYDSKNDGETLTETDIAECFHKDEFDYLPDGLVPRVWFQDLDTDDAVLEDYGMGISGNFILADTNFGAQRNIVGVQDYWIDVELDPTDTENTLPQVLGSSSANLSPNGFNPLDNNMFGYTELFGNTENYNIEISVPVRAQTNSTTSADLGVERPIVFGLNGVFSGSLKEVESSRLYRSVYPPVLKQLALKNQQDIKTNQIEVRVKRAGSNKQATEIIDCQVELLIN